MTTSTSQFSKLRRKISGHSHYIRLTSLFLGFSILIFLLFSFLSPISNLAKTLLQGPGSIISFTQDPIKNLRSTNNQTNVLLLGMGGEGHEGSLLTDSMLIISYNHDTKKISLISLPRDLWVDSLKTKINATYYYGEQDDNSNGLTLAKSSITEVTGLPVHYGFAMNFEGFKEAIDLVGGVDINIESTFDDYLYPIPGMEDALPEELRYEHLHFDAGLESMDGDRALKYVRSRHAEGEDGTDFARNRRQQLVLAAFKDKLLSTKTLLNPKRISELFDLYRQYIDTDILDTEYAPFAKIVISADRDKLKTVNLTTGDPENNELGILEVPANKTPYGDQWVLIARDNNWNALKQYIQNELNQAP